MLGTLQLTLAGLKASLLMVVFMLKIYLHSKFILNYPSVSSIINRLIKLGHGSLLFIINISRGFRQLKVDLGDIHLLYLKQDTYFTDKVVPFGYRHGLFMSLKMTDVIRFIMKNHGFPELVYYVGELSDCEDP